MELPYKTEFKGKVILQQPKQRLRPTSETTLKSNGVAANLKSRVLEY